MRTARSVAILAAFLSLSEGALNLVKRDNPAVVGATTNRRSGGNPVEHDRRKWGSRSLQKRASDVVDSDLYNQVTLYFINVTLGTPAQDFALHIDTGSSDLWVNTASSALCKRYSQICEEAGVYDSSASSTYKHVNNDFNVTYADGSAATGPYVTDTLGVSGTTIRNFEFGVGDTSSSPEGILGVGYPLNEGITETNPNLVYANLPKALQNNGDINSNAYSLYLNDLDANQGTILFGGVDTTKFTGTLQTLPIISTYGYYSEFLVALTGVGVNGNANSLVSNQAVAVLLDSGTSLTYLPNDVTDALFKEYNTAYDENDEAAPVPCSLAQQTGSVDYTFSSFTISVPLSELVINISNDPSQESCAFGIAPSGTNGPTILGDTFLRSAYVVYDLSNNEISMAQATYDNSAENILEIQSGTTGVPSATPVPSAVTAVGNVFTGAIGDLGPTALATGSTTGSDNAAAAMMTPAPVWKIGSGFAAGVAALAML